MASATSDDEIIEILRMSNTVAVVGISDKPDRDSFQVARYLVDQGYRIIPVNPMIETVLGLRCYASLRDIPERIDVVDIFRRSEAVPEIVDEAIAVGAKVIWMQLGVANEEAAEKAGQAGLKVVMDRCVKRDHSRLLGRGAWGHPEQGKG
jgi:predicted CoA-binding protein